MKTKHYKIPIKFEENEADKIYHNYQELQPNSYMPPIPPYKEIKELIDLSKPRNLMRSFWSRVYSQIAP